MKAKSRKRLLISSVAMLLVAMLALGTATFAWFTQATTAYANNLAATAEKSSMLLLSKSTGQWTNHVNYNWSETAMKPASTTDGTTWVHTYAEDGSGAKATSAVVRDVTSENNGEYVFKEELNVKNNGTIDYKNVNFTVSGFSTESDIEYACFALVSKDTSVNPNATTTAGNVKTEAGTFGASNASKAITGVIYQKTAGSLPGMDAAGAVRKDGDTPAPFSTTSWNTSNFKIDVPDLPAGGEAYYDLYIWFDGTDPDCVDAKSGQSIGSLRFEINGTQDTTT